jgi:ubiquinone/menaquinone biosynthesis C-methylase UbiE
MGHWQSGHDEEDRTVSVMGTTPHDKTETETDQSALFGYSTTWMVEESLDSLNERIHDRAPLDQLLDRANGYRDWMFNAVPEAAPPVGARMMELGSGVGWIMQAMLDAFPMVTELVGLDISANMIQRAQERFQHPAARFQLYDGLSMPFRDGYFDVVYSVAAIQHIEKHIAFLLFEEIHRILRNGGHALLHVLSVDHIRNTPWSYHDECVIHVENVPTHWHHYYSFDELLVLFSDSIGVTDLDIIYEPAGSFLVHFSKGSERRFRRPELPGLTYWGRLGRP